jgi:hypothetical protein
MYGDGKHTYTRNVGSYNDDDLRKFWFQALFTKKTTTHYVETTRVRPVLRLWTDISDETVCWILLKFGVRIG